MTRHDPERADRIVSFIEEFAHQHGYGPSVRDICRGVGLSSTAAGHHQLMKLERAGRIHWDREVARSIRVIHTRPDDGLCERPGCGKPIPPREPGHRGMARVRWCSNSCAVKAAQVRAWLRGAGMGYVVIQLGLD